MQWPLLATSGLDDALVELGVVVIDLAPGGVATEVEGVSFVGNVAPSRLSRWSADSSCVAIPARSSYSNAPSTGDDAVWLIHPMIGRAVRTAASSALDAELLAAMLTTRGLNTKAAIECRPQMLRPQAYAGGAGQINGGAWQSPSQQVIFWNAPVLTVISSSKTSTISGEFLAVQPPVIEGLLSRTVVVRSDGNPCLLTVDADECRVDALRAHREWDLLAVNTCDGSVVYKEDIAQGTFLRLARAGQPPLKSPLSFNTYFGGVCRSQERLIGHTFPDGSVRRGLLQLPPNHRPGNRYPVIMWAYPDSAPSRNDSFAQPNSSVNAFLPVQYLLARGFAFFQAPFKIGRTGSHEPMTEAVDAVVPWLDALAKQREVIRGQVGFFGFSNAGYIALALEALTREFKAIVAWDTFPALGYGALHSYADDVALTCGGSLVQGFRMFYEDPTQPYNPLPAPPWKDAYRYIKNEPLFNLARASTPLLLVEGEFDVDPREMEEVYSILLGSGVPVELAYYWGEGHVLSSPGNISDCWSRTEMFFRKYLAAG